VSTWTAVLDDVATAGGTPSQVANRLRLPVSLVQAVLDHAERLGVVATAGRDCGSCRPLGPSGPEIPPACAGCPLALA
jgi:hypothetical protein